MARRKTEDSGDESGRDEEIRYGEEDTPLWFDLEEDEGDFDDDDDGGDSDDAGNSDGEETVDEERQRLYKEIVAELSNPNNDSPLFKQFRAELEARDQKLSKQDKLLEQLMSQIEELNEGANDSLNFIGSELYEALDEEGKKAMTQRLNERRTKRLEAQVRKSAAPAQQSGDVGDINEQLAKARTEFVGGLKEYAKEMGVDPDSANLDFGSEDDTAAVVNQKFLKSLKAAMDEEKETRSVGKKPAPQTRGSETSAPSRGKRGLSSAELISMGARKRIPKSVRGDW